MEPDSGPSESLNGRGDDAANREVETQESLPVKREYNVHLIHPISKQIVELGLHITEHAHGCNAFRVIEGGLAAKSKLQNGDQIRKINGRDLKDLNVEQIAAIFPGLDTTKTITFRVVRQHENDDGCYSQCEADITITIINGNDEIDTASECQSSTCEKKIKHTRNDKSTVYVRVDNDRAQVSTTLDEKCKFSLEICKGGDKGQRLCVIRNVSSGKVFEKTADLTDLGLKLAAQPLTDGTTDDTCFYWYDNGVFHVFQSATDKKLFIAVNNDNSLYLKRFNSVSDVDQTGKFEVIDEKENSHEDLEN